MKKTRVCPVCGKHECDINDEYSICPVCDWGYDYVQEDYPDFEGGFNIMSLNQAKQEWAQKQKSVV